MKFLMPKFHCHQIATLHSKASTSSISFQGHLKSLSDTDVIWYICYLRLSKHLNNFMQQIFFFNNLQLKVFAEILV